MTEHKKDYEKDLSEILNFASSHTQRPSDSLKKQSKDKTAKKKIDVKLFVGQIPKHWEEQLIFDFFSQYGEILETQVLRDNSTGESKGCAFVRFASMTEADDAKLTIERKHVIIPGMKREVQISWAIGEEERLKVRQDEIPKLFIGNVPPDTNEESLWQIFEPYGKIQELFTLKDQQGNRKGCAFVRYQTKEEALLAIHALDKKVLVGKSHKPMEVRFADKQKKTTTSSPQVGEVKVNPIQSSNLLINNMGMPTLVPFQNFNMMAFQQTPNFIMPNQNPNMIGINPTQTLISQNQATITPNLITPTPTIMTQNLMTPNMMTPNGMAHNFIMPNPFMAQNPMLAQNFMLQNQYSSLMQTQQAHQNSQISPQNNEQKSGPQGANLFIYQLPLDWTDDDLTKNFKDFGTLLSVKVATDAKTGQSKGYGFITYTSAEYALDAIKNMNDLVINNKKLRVELKKSDSDLFSHAGGSNQPYQPY